jgi:hypothetical protein
VGHVCEIIQLTFLKAPVLIREMEANGTLGDMYGRLKAICKREGRKIP